jgi:segregation and condensation protein A
MPAEPDRAAALLAQAPAEVGQAGAPALRLGAYDGPLDRLLELARAQRIDLAPLSIASLAEQVAAAVTAAIAARQVPLPRLADWLIMAAWLSLLQARRLLPAEAAERAEARREAEGLRQRLADRDAARRLADWLERRPQLGREVFGRGAADAAAAAAAPVADPTALLQACLVLLTLPPRDRVYRPQPPALWRVPEALARMRGMLPGLGEGADLVRFLPPPTDAKARSRLQRRVALASTLLAGLELSREGSATLAQEEAFGTVRLRPGPPPA